MCFNERRNPAIIVTVLSGIVLTLGVLMVVESAIFYTRDSILTATIGSLTDKLHIFRISFFGVLMAFSCSAVLIGACGICCFCKPCARSKALPIFYGIFLLFVWIVILVIGILISIVSFAPTQTVQSFCAGNTTNSRLTWVSDQIETIDV